MVFFGAFSWGLSGQEVVKSILLESIDIRPGQDSIPLEEVIQIIMTDTSYYQSFRATRKPGYSSEGQFQDAEEPSIQMSRQAKSIETMGRGKIKRTAEVNHKKIINRRGRYKYLTARMYDKVFFPTTSYPLNTELNREFDTDDGSRMDQFENQLKQLLFNPGAPIPGVPFMADRLAIFSEEMIPKYRFEVWLTSINGIGCIGFKATAKEPEDNSTVIKELTTYIEEARMQVKERTYRMAFSNLFLSFNIFIETQVELGAEPYLKWVKYDGGFDLPFTAPENVQFWVKTQKHD